VAIAAGHLAVTGEVDLGALTLREGNLCRPIGDDRGRLVQPDRVAAALAG
jgi:hypothetical protein